MQARTFVVVGSPLGVLACVVALSVAVARAPASEPIPLVYAPASAGDPIPAGTTMADFYRGGSQPSAQYAQLLSARNCGFCHGGNDSSILINKSWAGSIHSISARDPLWFACLTVAEQDAPFVGEWCIRCHAPRAWIAGRGLPSDGSAINELDKESIGCHFCHRMVDPFYKPGLSPIEDEQILQHIVELPVTNGSAAYVLDKFDRRRSTRGDPTPHTNLRASFYGESAHCETCHDVSGPALDRMPGDVYVGNDLDTPHPTQNKYDMFPSERTFSEWAESEYAKVGVDAGGRFGGNKRVVSSCQDCHMPDSSSRSATGMPIRHDMADHGMFGGATWIPLVVANLYPDAVDRAAIEAGVAGSRTLLELSATMELSQQGDVVTVRIINETGHKLPTGQAEGRQMWVNVQFFDAGGTMIAERGAYDEETGTPHAGDSKMYEIMLGIDEATASAVNLPVGPTHHVAFCNVIYKDNRIPPRGFTNEAYRRVQAPVVGATYRDGQYWDDTAFVLPEGAASVRAALYYKTAATDFIEFLRDANHTNDAGQILYDQWVATGMSPPVEMVVGTVDPVPFVTGDFNADSHTDLRDVGDLLSCLTGPDAPLAGPGCEVGDLSDDGDVDVQDVGRMMRRLRRSMPSANFPSIRTGSRGLKGSLRVKESVPGRRFIWSKRRSASFHLIMRRKMCY